MVIDAGKIEYMCRNNVNKGGWASQAALSACRDPSRLFCVCAKLQGPISSPQKTLGNSVLGKQPPFMAAANRYFCRLFFFSL